MSRTLVDCGADPGVVIGDSFSLVSGLGPITDDEELSQWVRETFEHLIDSVFSHAPDHRQLRIQLVLNYLREHYGEPIRRDELAARMGMSRAHFSRTVKEATGRSFSELLQQMRIEKATGLLRQTDWTILAIALECGFEEAAYFTRVFKKVIGQSPSEFRKRAP